MDPFPFLEKRLQALSIEGYEIYLIESTKFSARAKDGDIEFVEEAEEKGLAIRLFDQGRCGLSCTSHWEEAFLERMVHLAYNGLSMMEKGGFGLPENSNPLAAGEIKKRPAVPLSDKLAVALELEKTARAYDPRVSRVRDSSYHEEETRVTIKNSKGMSRSAERFLCEVSLMVMAQDKTSQEMAWESAHASSFEGLSPRALAEQAAEKAVSQLGAKPVVTQKAPALLDSMVATSFLGVLAASFLGDNVQKNRSLLKDRVGEKIYSEAINLLDDGLLPEGSATFPFDAEGIAMRKKELVFSGVLKNFLHDTTSAARASTASTGNSIKSNYKDFPHVGPTNFFINPGKLSSEALLSEMGQGFWVRDVIGVHTVDPVTGDFSLGASGAWVEGGKKSSPVRGVTISGNLHEMFKNVVQVGRDLKFYGSYGSAPLLIQNLDVGGL